MTRLICNLRVASHVNNRKDVLEGHVGEKDEQGAVDVHRAVLIHLLAKINDADQQRDHLRRKIQISSLSRYRLLLCLFLIVGLRNQAIMKTIQK